MSINLKRANTQVRLRRLDQMTPRVFAQTLYITRDLGDTILYLINQYLISKRYLRHQNGVLAHFTRLVRFESPNQK